MKIGALELVSKPDGSETIPMVKNGQTRRGVIGTLVGALAAPYTGTLPTGLAAMERLRGLSVSLSEFTDGVGRGNATADTDAFMLARTALVRGDIAALRLPAATLYLEDHFDIDAPPGRVAILGEGREATRIVTSVTDAMATARRQYPWVIRNTSHGALVRGFAIEVDAPDIEYYQNAFTFMNVSNLTLEDFVSDGSQQYGVGIFDDVMAAPGTRTATACDNVVIRNGLIRNASQYGIQHFPKVLSDGFLLEGVTLLNCGRNVQEWSVPDEIQPAAVKAGQATRRSILHNIDIVCAADANGIAIANYEDYVARRVRIRNAQWQAIAISAGTHPDLITRCPEAAGDPKPAPYLSSHGTVDIEATIEHSVEEAGKRKAAFISGQLGRTANTACKAAATANITLSGEQTVGGVPCTVGDRVLATGQTNAAKNGIYVVASGTWSRANDFDATDKVTTGSVVNVTGGSARGGWILISADPHKVGSTGQIWSPFNPHGPRIRAKISGEVIEAGSYAGFNGAVEFAAGVDFSGLDLAIDYTAGSIAGLTGSPALPPAVAYLRDDTGGKAVAPKLSIRVDNPDYIAQHVFMALWLKGQNGGDVRISARNMGDYVFRGDDNTGIVKVAQFDVTDFNLGRSADAAPISISGSMGEYHFENPSYHQTAGVGEGAFWVLGGGSASVFLTNPRASGVSLAVSVNPMKVYQFSGRRGVVTLTAGTATVSFGALSEPDANYMIKLSGDATESLGWANKTESGFSINSSDRSSAATVEWEVSR
jgi:hypothetical protein